MLLQFYHCPICGNIIVKVIDSGVIPVCCGSEMELLVPKTEEEFKEKHLPVVVKHDRDICEIRIGEVPHPMNEEHHISFICVQTASGFELHYLSPDDMPESMFICEDKAEMVYAFCNKHGLWAVDMKDGCKGKLFKKHCRQ